MNTKVIASLVLSAIVAGVVVSATNADFDFEERSFDRVEFKQNINKGDRGLTDEEKTQLESMTQEEKDEFFETKRVEKQAEMEEKRIKREAKETVIDKLLAGESLTEEEETIRSEIITERAERKAEMEERQVKMEEFRTIMEKKRNGEELIEDEQTLIDEMKSSKQKGGKRGFNK